MTDERLRELAALAMNGMPHVALRLAVNEAYERAANYVDDDDPTRAVYARMAAEGIRALKVPEIAFPVDHGHGMRG